jgi:hypothetical protein
MICTSSLYAIALAPRQQRRLQQPAPGQPAGRVDHRQQLADIPVSRLLLLTRAGRRFAGWHRMG